MRSGILTLAMLLAAPALIAHADVLIDFEDLTLAPDSFNSTTGGFSSGGAGFNNQFGSSGPFTFWSGWAYSNMGDTTTAGFGNQYSSFTGGDASGDGNFGIAFNNSAHINLPDLGAPLISMSTQVTNTTYAAISMLQGDSFAKRFGGASGNDPDYFLLTITGYDGLGATGGVIDTIEYYLADYRFDDNSLDYIIDTWETVDLTSLIGARSLGFGLSSSDVGAFGMNTPAYFALDNLRLTPVPEPSSITLLALGVGSLGFMLRRPRRAA